MTILTVAIWSACTALHFALCARFTARRLPESSVDERAWAAVLIGVAGLSWIVHIAVMFTSLSVASAAAAFVLFHMWLRFAGLLAAPRAILPAAVTGREAVGAAILIAIGLSWVDVASQSPVVLGPDAPGYHVPAAINLARGATLVDLPATQHLYPLAGSVVSAWFLWPFDSPLVVDLAQVLPFALLATSIGWLLRMMTGQSGLVWAVPVVLALCSMPVYRAVSVGSADLWFTAAAVALVVTLVSVYAHGKWRAIDWWLAGAAGGLLVGAKTTGIVTFALIGASYLLVTVAARVAGAGAVRLSAHATRSLCAGGLFALGAGGLWLLRNWWLFGSPVAPAGLSIGGLTIFEGTGWEPLAFRSVMSDITGLDGYRVGDRLREFAATWFAPWFLPAMALLVVYAVDLLAFRSGPSETRRARAAALVLTIGAGSVLCGLVAGAPWTSLEWSRGFSLRYILPVPTLLAVIAAASLFPLRWPWYQRRQAAADVAWILALAGSLALFWMSTREAGAAAVPPIALPWIAAAAVIVSVIARVDPDRRARWAAAVGVGLALAWTPQLVRRDARAVDQRFADTAGQAVRFAAGLPIDADEARGLLLAAQQHERFDGAECATRRWFVLGRLDAPLALQDDRFHSLVFYAGRDAASARRAGPLARCDYVVTTPALRDTDKGRAIESALLGNAPPREVSRTPGFVVLTSGR